jgi:hypothetical protein
MSKVKKHILWMENGTCTNKIFKHVQTSSLAFPVSVATQRHDSSTVAAAVEDVVAQRVHEPASAEPLVRCCPT